MYTGVKLLILSAVLQMMACKHYSFQTPRNGVPGFIDLATVPFCAAFEFSDSAKKKYELTAPSPRALYIMQQMQDYSGISMEVGVWQGKVPNALAATIEGKKVVVYNEDFMNLIDKVSNSAFWQSLYILAHETGHHLYAHILATDTATRYKQELQADEFAGFILYRMGAAESTASWIMSTAYLQTDSDQDTHPPRSLRALAIEKGWEKGFAQASNIPVPPPPAFDYQDNHVFLQKGYFDCSDLLPDTNGYRFHSDFVSGCTLDSIITAGTGMVNYFMTDSLIGPEIFRDTLVGVILSLDKTTYDFDLGGFLENTNARIRIFKYDKQKNPLFNNRNLYINDISCPDRLEGGWNFFTKSFTPGQWLKFKVIVENGTAITNTYRMSYLEFIEPPKEVANQTFSSPF